MVRSRCNFYTVQTVYIQDGNLTMASRSIPGHALRYKFQLIAIVFCADAGKPHAKRLTRPNKFCKLVIKFYGLVSIHFILTYKSTNIICMVSHPTDGTFDTRYRTLISLALQHTVGTGSTLASNPLIGGRSRNGGHEHKEQHGDKGYTELTS